MKRFLLTFDVHDEHERIIDELTTNGWHSSIRGININTGKPGLSFLPETTWWVQGEDKDTVYQNFVGIAGDKNIVRADIFEFVDWRGVGGKALPHQLEEIGQTGNNAA
jgi:hypothetical protein